jgi:hypothetical protein
VVVFIALSLKFYKFYQVTFKAIFEALIEKYKTKYVTKPLYILILVLKDTEILLKVRFLKSRQNKKAPRKRSFFVLFKNQSSRLTVDSRSRHCDRCYINSSQVEREVVSVALVHYFHTQVSAVDYVCPARYYTSLAVRNRLVEVEAVQVERHCAYAQGGEPDANYWP